MPQMEPAVNTRLLSQRANFRIALSRTVVAVSIGVSPDSVDRMVEEGFLPQPRRWHTHKLWIVSEIEVAITQWPQDGPSKLPVDEEDWTPRL
jgi:hypothetical protein